MVFVCVRKGWPTLSVPMAGKIVLSGSRQGGGLFGGENLGGKTAHDISDKKRYNLS